MRSRPKQSQFEACRSAHAEHLQGLLMDEKVKHALVDGMSAVRDATAASFTVYRQGCKEDAHQQERTANGLIEIVLSAEQMLGLIDELSERQGKGVKS
jgi:hypothetical protein